MMHADRTAALVGRPPEKPGTRHSLLRSIRPSVAVGGTGVGWVLRPWQGTHAATLYAWSAAAQSGQPARKWDQFARASEGEAGKGSKWQPCAAGEPKGMCPDMSPGADTRRDRSPRTLLPSSVWAPDTPACHPLLAPLFAFGTVQTRARSRPGRCNDPVCV